jgi:hypothetical protein
VTHLTSGVVPHFEKLAIDFLDKASSGAVPSNGINDSRDDTRLFDFGRRLAIPVKVTLDQVSEPPVADVVACFGSARANYIVRSGPGKVGPEWSHATTVLVVVVVVNCDGRFVLPPKDLPLGVVVPVLLLLLLLGGGNCYLFDAGIVDRSCFACCRFGFGNLEPGILRIVALVHSQH